MDKLEKNLLKTINDFLDTLETKDGNIERDMTKISQFQVEMDKFFDIHGIPFLVWMVDAIKKLLKQATQDFREDGAGYEDVAFMSELLGIKGETVAKKRAGQPTVLYSLMTLAVIRQDMINKIQSAMVGDTRMKDFRIAVRRSIKKKFQNFFKVNATAILFNTFNAASYFYAKKFKYTKFRYEGGLIKDSRDFCIERDGNEFFIEQGKEWNELDWAGKMPGVDFFVQVGGYFCRHWLVYMKE
jgi:hypothetical protein